MTKATHIGRYFDLDPTGKILEVHEVIFNRMSGGRIAETWQVTGSPGLYLQLTGRRALGLADNQT